MARRRRIDRTMRELRERKYRLRAKTIRGRFIPDGDSDFAHMARTFAGHIAEHAERFGLSAEQVAKVNAAVEEYRSALAETIRPRTCGPMATRIKNDTRAKAEHAIRGAAGIIRGRSVADDSITSADRLMLNMHERPKRLKRRECPQIAPVLRFKGSPQDGTGSCAQRHILEYGNDFDRGSNAKPHGAARLELFVELVPPEWAVSTPGAGGEAGGGAGRIPTHPAQMSGGRLWYLRSFSTSRFEVEFPVMSDGTPMLVVYWGRWADATGAFGPFSRTCVARVEGGAAPQRVLPGAPRRTNLRVEHVAQQLEAKYVVIERPRELTEQFQAPLLEADLVRSFVR